MRRSSLDAGVNYVKQLRRSLFRKSVQIVLVLLSVSSDFGDPVASVRLRYARAALAIVAVPEAAMDEDHFLPANEGDVGLAGEIGAVEAVAIAELSEEAADDELGFGVFRANFAHYLRAA